MKTVTNKTHAPLRLPLPKGKTLHLGPNKTGQISVHDVDHPPLKKLAEDGKIEIYDQAGNAAIPTVNQGGAPHVRAWGDKANVSTLHSKKSDA